MNAFLFSPQFSPTFSSGQITIQYTVKGLQLDSDSQSTILRLTTPCFTTGVLVDLLTSLDQLGFTCTEIDDDCLNTA